MMVFANTGQVERIKDLGWREGHFFVTDRHTHSFYYI